MKLPECGIWIGSGVYPSCYGYLLSALYAHPSWHAEETEPLEMIERILRDNQGNLAQVWGNGRGYSPRSVALWHYALDEIGIDVPRPDWENQTHIRASDLPLLREHHKRGGAGTLRFIREAAKRGIYTSLIYTTGYPEWSTQYQSVGGDYYLGYDFGERFTVGISESNLRGKTLDQVNLRMLADDLIARVKEHVDTRRAGGWGPIMATSSNFYIDYEVVAGTDIPLVEDFAFQHLQFASALSRGLTRQFELPYWGSHLAHEHYSWIPNASPYKFFLFRASMYLKYMAGAKMIINESGNWFVEASLCEDSPKFNFPANDLTPDHVDWNGHKDPANWIPLRKEAEKHFDQVSYNGAIPRQYRKEISDFYDYVKANGTPAGQPESTIAIAKGNLDLCGHRYSPNAAVAGAFSLADANPSWFEGAPERGWETVKEIFFPRPPVIEPYENAFLAGTPHGMVDIVTFADEKISASFLSKNYKALLFSGWNTSSEAQYTTLVEYVKNGGTLFIGIPHLSTDVDRNYGNYRVDQLVRNGDFSELAGIKVKGRGRRIYWGTPIRGNEELGVAYPRRFGILQCSLGEIEITCSQVEALVVDDERAEPLLIRRKLGKGWVYFLNSWNYPGALNENFGPGSRTNEPGLIGAIYRHIALRSRGSAYITDDGVSPGEEAKHISYSYFPEDGSICLYNIDPDRARTIILHHQGKQTSLTLQPAEFKRLQTLP